MKKLVIISLALFFLFLSSQSSHSQIVYGSNNGKQISINGTNLYFEEYGSGTPLLMLHGGIGSIYKFRQAIPELANHFRVIAVDSPGHGRSEQADTLSYQLMADYFSQLIDQLGLDSVYVIGHSDGGNTALLLAYDRPDKVKRILVTGANSNIGGVTNRMINLNKTLDPQHVQSNMQDWLLDYKSKSPQKDNWEKFILDFKKMQFEQTIIDDSRLNKIECRTMVVMGDKEWVIKLEHGLALFRNIKGSEFCVLPNTPHDPWRSNTDLIVDIAIDFFSKK
ncbi:MAG: alpha/beta hydrolase [Bacteroidota bacterium]